MQQLPVRPQVTTAAAHRADPPGPDPYGTLSDDGRYAALLTWLPQGAGRELAVLDTASGRPVKRLRSVGPGDMDTDSYLWLPDGRLVGIHDGRFFTFEPRAGRLRFPDLKLPEALMQLTVRGRFS